MVNNTMVPLIIAGGGGGKSFMPGNAVNPDGGVSETGLGLTSETDYHGPGRTFLPEISILR